MPAVALALLALYAVLAVGVRMAVHVHRTGASGFSGFGGEAGTVQMVCGLLIGLAVMLLLAGPALQMAGLLGPVARLGGVADGLGLGLGCLGIALTVAAQLAMGDAWRIGVDHDERTALVTDGPFSLARNPIYAAMIPAFAGTALLAPDVITLAGAVLLAVAFELHTRLVEEPHLLELHGQRYASYAARVGRFLPGVGRLR